jgi:hypothetical protein
MKTLIVTAFVVFFGTQISVVKAETECHQGLKTQTLTVRSVREFR